MNVNESNSEHTRIAQEFRNLLNRHGFGFQYSSLREVEEISLEPSTSRWLFEAAEIPVQIGQKCTRVDFVLKSKNAPVYLIVECKRANPVVKHWCFTKAPYVRRNAPSEQLFVEHTRLFGSRMVSTGAILRSIDKDACHIALEVKSNEKGDCDGKGSGAIEEAASQVCLGLNGMVELFTNKPALFAKQSQAIFIPVIFTTAQIWISNVELQMSAIETGKLAEEINIEARNYIYFQYHQSPGLKHTLKPPPAEHNNLSAWLASDAIRTIPVISAKGIKQFLTELDDDIHFLKDI